jgi:hypothetical protein
MAMVSVGFRTIPVGAVWVSFPIGMILVLEKRADPCWTSSLNCGDPVPMPTLLAEFCRTLLAPRLVEIYGEEDRMRPAMDSSMRAADSRYDEGL